MDYKSFGEGLDTGETKYSQTRNEYLLREGKPTKRILPINGRLFVRVVVQSGNVISNQTGENSGNMVNWDFLLQGAYNNALHKHVQDGGKSGGVIIKVLDYWIIYFNDRVTTKRVRRTRSVVKKKTINVKSHFRNGVKVKGYKRVSSREIVKGFYETDIFLEGKRLDSVRERQLSRGMIEREFGMITGTRKRMGRVLDDRGTLDDFRFRFK